MKNKTINLRILMPEGIMMLADTYRNRQDKIIDLLLLRLMLYRNVKAHKF